MLRYIFRTNLWVLFMWSIFFAGCKDNGGGSGQSQPDYSDRREQMVKHQIEARGIQNPEVLAAMRKVERHRFVPPKYRSEAYNDYPLPIGSGQTISQPYIVAYMTEILQLSEKDKVLEIGTGSGYQAAVLAEIAGEVYTIEIFEKLANSAAEVLTDLGYENIHVRAGDGYAGWPEQAPFDAIIVTCSPTHIPAPLQDQLAEGGKMIIPVGTALNQELYLLEKQDTEIVTKAVLPVRFVPMLKYDGSEY